LSRNLLKSKIKVKGTGSQNGEQDSLIHRRIQERLKKNR
jgi:hypothetical protein